MPLILEREQVLALYETAAARGWVLPAFNTENPTTTEAILAAALEFGKQNDIPDVPVIIGITNNYPDRPQAVYHTHSRHWPTGMRLFLREMEVLAGPESPYAGLPVMIHLDHIQWDRDAGLLEWDMGAFSSIMYDASGLPLSENMRRTAAFVREHGREIVIEGACDMISPVAAHNAGLTGAEDARLYLNSTGVDVIVANLGTEHRSARAAIRYDGRRAREITERLGRGCLCLHGASSVPPEHLGNLFNDGIRRVNIWTALERESSAVLLREMLRHATGIAGRENVRRLKEEEWLGSAVAAEGEASVDFCTTTYRQGIVFTVMKELIKKYLGYFYK